VLTYRQIAWNHHDQGMTHPSLKLMIAEPVPGTYIWSLVETDARGDTVRVVRRADDASDSYEAALAIGTRRLHAALHELSHSSA
jgi:hypothetical protein